MNYKIAVTSVNFDKNYDNVIRFNSKTERNAYFNIPAIFEDVPVCNFNASSLLRTSVTARFDAATDLTQLLMSNYCIVQNVEKPEEIYFYFVLSAEQKSGSTIQLQLEIDIFQTFYLDVDFSECFINRAHLDRFNEEVEEKSNGAYVTFKSGDTEDNLLYESEDIEEPPKRIVSRGKVTWDIFPNNDSANSFLSTYVIAWIYVYVAPNEGFQIIGGDSPVTYDNLPGLMLYRRKKDATTTLGTPNLEDYENGYYTESSIMVFPIVEQGYSFKLRRKITGAYYEGDWNTEFLQTFINNCSPYIRSIKLSLMPPFFRRDEKGDETTMTASVNVANATMTITLPDDEFTSHVDVNFVGIINVSGTLGLRLYALPMRPQEGYFYPQLDADLITSSDTIRIEDILNSTHDPQFNPKMYNDTFRELQISTPDGKTYAYSFQKLNAYKTKINIKYIENLTADTTRMFAYVDDPNNPDNLYTKLLGKAYVGALSSADFAMPYSSDQLVEYLAQNKNFYEQTKYNAFMEHMKRMLSGVMGIGPSVTKGFASGGPIGALFGLATGMQQAASDSLISGMSSAQTRKNMEYTADNLRSAPDIVKEASGSAIFNLTLREFQLNVDIYEPLKADKVRINDFMHRYGYTVQRLGKIKDYDHIRHYFNFVMAEVEEVLSDTVNISLDVRDMFKQAFAHGVRFWNPEATMYDFDPENYEERFTAYANEETAA